VLGQHRSTQRRVPKGRDDEERLTEDIVTLARQYGRYGYRKIAELLRRQSGWVVNDKRVERIWRREGLKVPAKQPKKGRLWLNDGSCIRLRAERPNHVWSYDFVEDRTDEGRKYRMLNVIDEFTHEALAIRIDRKLNSIDVIDVYAVRPRSREPSINLSCSESANTCSEKARGLKPGSSSNPRRSRSIARPVRPAWANAIA
jgi:putative transposase